MHFDHIDGVLIIIGWRRRCFELKNGFDCVEVWLVGWLLVGGGRFLIMRQIDGADMMVLVGPLGLISMGGGMGYQLAACYTFHMHACMYGSR